MKAITDVIQSCFLPENEKPVPECLNIGRIKSRAKNQLVGMSMVQGFSTVFHTHSQPKKKNHTSICLRLFCLVGFIWSVSVCFFGFIPALPYHMGMHTQMDHFLEDFDPAYKRIFPRSFGLSVTKIEQ